MQEPTLLPLTGFLITYFIDLINRKIKDSDTRRIIAYIFCIVWGSAINIIQHNGMYAGLTLEQIAMSFLVDIGAVIGFSQVTYKGIPGTGTGWEDSDLRNEIGFNAKTL